MPKNRLSEFIFTGGYISSAARSMLRNVLAFGSKNGLLDGLGYIRAFRGLSQAESRLTGSTQLFQTDNTFAGLGSHTAYGKGSVFKVQRVLVFVGQGALRVAGDAVIATANSTLQYVKKIGGVFSGTAYQAGHARPSSQTIYPKTAGAGFSPMSGLVATVIWRTDSTTGQVSNASFVSNVLLLNNQTVIQQFPSADANGQDYWGIGVPKPGFGADGVMYQLRTELGGEVAESVLAYARTTGTASIADTSNVVNDAGGNFTAADIGRRYSFSTFDSWITEVVTATRVKVNDANNSGGTISGAGMIRHAVQGILRAVEISWTAESLAGQDIAPFDAYPPPSNISWAGILNDTVFVETDEGIIFVGVPGYLGSFPPKNAIFPSEPATCYLDGSDGVHWRFSKQTLSAITYIGGEKPLEMQQVWKNAGVLFPQNAAIGAGGRVIAWTGKPVRLGAGRDPEIAFAFEVYKDFEGWENQTASRPVICEHDSERQLEVWAKDRKIMCFHVPTEKWCSPIDVTPYLTANEYLLSAVSVDKKLRFTTNTGVKLQLWMFDEGNGSTMVIRTPDADSQLETDTITQVDVKMRVDNTTNVQVSVIKNYNDVSPVQIQSITPPPGRKTVHLQKVRPNIVNAKSHAVEVTVATAGGDCGVEKIEVFGESSGVFIG